MTTTTPTHHEPDPSRLRDLVPAAAAVLLLLGVALVGGVLLRELAEFGAWLLGEI